GQTRPKAMPSPANRSIDAPDSAGAGNPVFAHGAGWKGAAASKEDSTLQWLKRGKDIDDPWTVYPIDLEPTVHRIRFADIDGKGKAALISLPLMGRNATAKSNWTDGSPVRVTAYRIPAAPTN